MGKTMEKPWEKQWFMMFDDGLSYGILWDAPSAQRLRNHTMLFMGKITILTGPFSIAMLN